MIIKCYCEANNQWVLAVSDTGIGIAPQNRERIFEPFARAQYSNRQHFPDSTGLELAIVARLVKLLQGEISLTSQLAIGSTKYSQSCQVLTFPHINQDELYSELNRLGWYWQAKNKKWERDDTPAREATCTFTNYLSLLSD